MSIELYNAGGMNSLDIEIAVAQHLGYRQNLIVPNVFWGLGFRHELDLLVLTPSKYAWEIEIKISKSDLIADQKKSHQHYSEKIKRLYFAVPEELKEFALLHIPERAGLFVVSQEHRLNATYYGNLYTTLIKLPKINKSARILNDNEINKLYQLCAMRIWSLKQHLQLKLNRKTQ
jgi:hypothetical protein